MLTVKVVVFVCVCVQRSDWCKLVKKAPCPQERMKVYLYAYVHVCVYMCTSNMYIICMYEVYIYYVYVYIYIYTNKDTKVTKVKVNGSIASNQVVKGRPALPKPTTVYILE